MDGSDGDGMYAAYCGWSKQQCGDWNVWRSSGNGNGILEEYIHLKIFFNKAT